MIISTEIENLDAPLKYIDLAKAYLESSIFLCKGMSSNEFKGNFSRSRVVLSLAFHAVELFLKGAIFKAKNEAPDDSHNLLDLKEEYEKLFPGERHQFASPFGFEVLPATGDVLGPKRKHFKTLDQQYRYHFSKKGKEWGGLKSFDPKTFIQELTTLNTDFERISSLLLK